MQKLLDWTLKTIREESDFSWMEECRYYWTPLVKSAVSKILSGQSVLILTDESNQWFCDYVMSKINMPSNNRPFFPFYPMRGLFPNITFIASTQDIELLEDMLDISYPNGHFIWYIGKGDHPLTKLVYRDDENFMWVMDEEMQNSFHLRSQDPMLDVKLLQLFKLFNHTIDAALFDGLEIEG